MKKLIEWINLAVRQREKERENEVPEHEEKRRC